MLLTSACKKKTIRLVGTIACIVTNKTYPPLLPVLAVAPATRFRVGIAMEYYQLKLVLELRVVVSVFESLESSCNEHHVRVLVALYGIIQHDVVGNDVSFAHASFSDI